MEADVPTPDPGAARAETSRADWRSLSHLRERVFAAAQELERLRTENAALAQRVLELQDGRDAAPSFAFGEAGGDAEAVRQRVQGFIDAIDTLLAREAEPSTDDAA